VVGALGAGLLLAVVVVSALVASRLGGDDSPGRTGSDQGGAPGPSAEAPTEVPGSSTDVDETTSGPAPTGPAQDSPVVCWDGAGAEVVEECTYPTGPAGLRWVFPSMGTQDCNDLKAQNGSPRTQLWECLAQLSTGEPVRVQYSQWPSLSMGFSHFEEFLDDRQDVLNKYGELALYRWTGYVDGSYEHATMDAREPWSVAVFVDDPGLVDAAVEELVRIRPFVQFQGVPR
jgi:hypothetical protein